MNQALIVGASSELIGRRVRSLIDFSGVPKGTEGVIDEIYRIGTRNGLMVAWDFPNRPLPQGYSAYDGKWAVSTGILRDGFGEDETKFLELL